jgi:hypothetical protein
MPKPKKRKNGEAFFDKKHAELQKVLTKQCDGVQDNLRTVRQKHAGLLKTKCEFIKHNQVRKVFLQLSKLSNVEKTVNAINECTKEDLTPNGGRTRGEQWEEKYIENLQEMCRLTEDALTNYRKFIAKKEEEEKKIVDIQKRAEEFHNSCLAKLKEYKEEGNRPFEVTSNTGSSGDRLYANTPFQCYQDHK